ncbi:hypothetical protein V8E55_007455 [Tylopilus felleus]
MSRSALSFFITLAIASRSALAQIDPADPNPLTAKTYAWPSQIANPVTTALRGPQTGYNICNSTTQNQQSECQTGMFDSIGRFCIWAPAQPNSTIGDTEGQEVSWCSMNGFGTRLIPENAITGAQWLVAKDSTGTVMYHQLFIYINQVMVNLNAQDYGGELDPHGADLRGNPIGGLMYSTAFSADNTTVEQVTDWNSFIGGNATCFTICNPSSSSADQSNYCQNIYDLLGCAYNMPNNAQNGVYEVCDSDLKTPVGIYVSGGVTMTYSQPATGPVTPPYTPVVPSSSNCVTYQSTDLFTGLPTITTTGASTTPTGGRGATGSGSAGAPSATTNGAPALGISTIAGILGTLFAIAFLS